MTQNEQEKNEENRPGSHLQGKLLSGQNRNEVAPDAPRASPAEGDIPEITEASKRFYERVIRLMTKYSTAKRSSDILEPVAVAPKDIVEDLFERDDIQGKTFRIYKSAMIWYLRNNIADQNFADAYLTLRRLEIEKKNQESAAQSTQRKRRKTRVIPESDYNLLVEELAAGGMRSKWSYRAQYFLMSVLATGVRPTEWPSAEWIDPEKTTLRVVSAKKKLSDPAFMRKADFVQTQEGGVSLVDDEPGSLGKAPDASTDDLEQTAQTDGGDEAEFDEEDLGTRDILVDEKDRFTVETHMRLIREHLDAGGDYYKYYTSARIAIHRACNNIWDGRKLYSLYTMRSQFSANKKATVGAAKTAVMMGHSRPDSPSTGYYGKARQAHSAYRKGAQADRGSVNPETFAPQEPAQSPADAPSAAPPQI